MKTRLIGLLSLVFFSLAAFAQTPGTLAWPGVRGQALDYVVVLNHAWIAQTATVKISPSIGGALYPANIQPTATRSGDTLRVHFDAAQSAKLQNDTYVVISTGGTIRYSGYLNLGSSANTGGTIGGTASWNLITDKPSAFPSTIDLIPGLTTALGNLLPTATYNTFLANYTTAINNLNTAQLTKLTKDQADLLYKPINSTAVTSYSNVSGLGTMATQNAGAVAITGGTISASSLTIPAYNTSSSQLKIGGMEAQGYSLNNSWIGDNMYYDAGAFRHRVTGSGSMLVFQAGETQIRQDPSQVAGAALPENGAYSQLKSNLDGTFVVGPQMSGLPGNYSGATFRVDPAGGVHANAYYDIPSYGSYRLGNVPALHATGTGNLFAGIESGNLTLTGQYNTSAGYNALNLITTGNYNSAFGSRAGNANTSATQNTFLGVQAGQHITTGGYNTFVGVNAGSNPALTSGVTNSVFLGNLAGGNLAGATYDNVVFIGNNAGAGEASLSNWAIIGNSATPMNLRNYGNILVGPPSGTAGTPKYISQGQDYSNTAGTHLKLKLFDPGSESGEYGLGVSGSQMDLVVPANSGFGFFAGGTKVASLGANGDFTPTQIHTINVTANGYYLSGLQTPPASATASGFTGEIRFTTGFVYLCVATNTWVRAALSTW